MSDQGSLPALIDECAVREFASGVLGLAADLQASLHRLSGSDKTFAVVGYGLLMEVYGLRTRSHILSNDSANHVVNSLSFSQSDLLSLFDRISRVARVVDDVRVATSIVISVATFTVSLGADRARVVNFLFGALCDEAAEWEVLLN
ncbi:hypothetical protein [Pseudomonas aeruginosa]|uniref:hypothetical protein n=1 Tax=Pseudomonas aeruginosa TaxID=287 RepID=UPI00104DC8DC|nr:hypothetical protein [Pseudomonas aeruginosa]